MDEAVCSEPLIEYDPLDGGACGDLCNATTIRSLEHKLPRPLEEERGRALVCYLAYKSMPPASNQLLRAVHVQSLARSRVAASDQEAVFVAKLWASPTDAFGFEEYEKYLIGQGDKTRSRRVRRFRETLRQRRNTQESSNGQ